MLAYIQGCRSRSEPKFLGVFGGSSTNKQQDPWCWLIYRKEDPWGCFHDYETNKEMKKGIEKKSCFLCGSKNSEEYIPLVLARRGLARVPACPARQGGISSTGGHQAGRGQGANQSRSVHPYSQVKCQIKYHWLISSFGNRWTAGQQIAKTESAVCFQEGTPQVKLISVSAMAGSAVAAVNVAANAVFGAV